MLKRLRSDQEDAIVRLREVVGSGEKRIVMQAPTGFGKALVMADITAAAVAKGRKVMITVPMISLVDQMVDMLAGQGVADVGVVQATHHMQDYGKPVQVCSVQTLAQRGLDKLPEAAVVLVDECHKWFDFFGQWFTLPKWEKVPIIGVSATPWTKGLGSYFRELVTVRTIGQMMEAGTLASFRTFAPDRPDLNGVRNSGDDYVQDDVYQVMRGPRLTASIVESWRELGEDRPTVCFCVNRAHAAQVAKEFEDKGIASGYMDCNTPLWERAEVRQRFLRGDIRVVCNVDVIGLGVDWPEVSCISYCRPTRSDIRFVQNIGRGLRTSPGKKDLIVIDHSDTTLRLGFVSEIYSEHTLLDDGKAKAKQEKGVQLPKLCPECFFLKPPRQAVCPNCGHRVEQHAEPILCERGTLREIKPGEDDPLSRLRKRLPERAHVFGQLKWWAAHKGYKDGWAFYKYRELYAVKYVSNGLEWQDKVSAPTPEVLEVIFFLQDKRSREWRNEKRREGYARRKQARVMPARPADALMDAQDWEEDFR
jgi:DNA repair protein RadD